MPVGIDPGDPRHWGVAPIEAEDGTGRAPRISFDEFMRAARRDARREGELTMGELDAWLAHEERDRNRRRYYENEICRDDGPHPYDISRMYDEGVLNEDDARRAMTLAQLRQPPPTRQEAIRLVAGAYDLPEEVIAPRPEYDELIASTRAEFPPDPYEYGRYCPQGPMRWTPPEDGEEVPRWLA